MTAAALRKQSPPEPATPRQRADMLAARLGAADATEILSCVIGDAFPKRIALVSSFGAESAVLLHLVARTDPATPVLFIDTAKHFAQTLSYRTKLAKRLGLTDMRAIAPAANAIAATDPDGDLWRRDPDACCTLRKVRPLETALDGFDAWITGRKQFHGGARLALPTVEAAGDFIKVNPLARWSPGDIDAYMRRHDLPPHPLVEQGYPSIGCWPCTHPARERDVRAGRWRGAAKTECGIHEISRTRTA